MKKQGIKTGVSLRLVRQEVEKSEFDPRLEAYWTRFLTLSLDERRKEVKRLFSQLYKYQREKKARLANLNKAQQNETEIARTLRMIGRRMRG
ncbi:hypothetical protein ACO1KB_02800 [Leptospira interrogans serovar Szwajizak]|uniref:hypothetical protein n=1 Tax=Leptospira interrogans TaxID=173 RepID=UPI00034D4A73|nr:hypothetical protein [Leptospira interrogans]